MLYLISFALFVIGVLILIMAPKNLVDNFLFMSAVIILFIAILTDPSFGKNNIIAIFFLYLQQLTSIVAPWLLVILGTGVILHAVRLFRIEQNKLQLAIAIFLGVVLLLLTISHYYQYYFLKNSRYEQWMVIPSLVMAYYVILFLNYVIATLRLTLFQTDEKKDYVIVLGAQLDKKGQLTPELLSRLDTAKAYVEHHKFLYKKYPQIIVSGAQTQAQIDESEAERMGEYLVSKGIPTSEIIIESQANNTHENFIYAVAIIESHKRILKTVPTAFVTSNYHLYRSQLYANMEGLYQASAIGAPSRRLEHFVGMIREFMAILFMHRKFHLLITLILIGIGIIQMIHFPIMV